MRDNTILLNGRSGIDDSIAHINFLSLLCSILSPACMYNSNVCMHLGQSALLPPSADVQCIIPTSRNSAAYDEVLLTLGQS
jgi:hypothetical protein